MSTNRYLKASLMALGGLTLSACAAKQVWVPELDQARNTYDLISQDAVVASLAAVELQEAQRQLASAEIASDQFKNPEQIKHEAKLASLRALIAQQRARSLSANHALQLALGQQPLLQQDQIAAATAPANPATAAELEMIAANPEPPQLDADFGEPVMAAALASPDYPSAVMPQQSASVEAQLQQLRQQIDLLQAQVQQQGVDDTTMNQDALASTQPVAPRIIQYQSSPGVQQPEPLLTEEPFLATALPTESPAQSVESKPLPSTDRLRQELLAMNAKAGSRGMSLTLGERYFADGSSRLWGGRAARHLDNVAAILSENPDLTLDIEAHTDNAASSDASHDLSVNRAIAIKSALVLRGINQERINAVGYGDSRPLAENTSDIGRLQNRRVDLVFPDIPVASL